MIGNGKILDYFYINVTCHVFCRRNNGFLGSEKKTKACLVETSFLTLF